MSTKPIPPEPPAPSPRRTNVPSSPIPGSKAYRDLRTQILRDRLATIREPVPGKRDAQPNTRERLEQWSKAIALREAQIQRLGAQVDLGFLQSTLRLQVDRMLVYWRLFRFMDLPPEIIANILHFVVWSSTHPSEGVKQRLYLTWVCKAWRRLMIEDPMIWNAIWFHDAPPYERSWEWFERAGSARLDIRLNEADPKRSNSDSSKFVAEKFTAERMSDILDKLFTKLSQIRMLVVIVDNWPPALTVLQKLQTAGNAGIPISIERLEIHRSGVPYVWIGPGFDTQGHRDPAVLFGGQTHHLQYLCLSGIHIDFNDTPLSNLTTLDLRHIAMESSPTLKRFRDILRSCPNLDKLTLDGGGPQQEEKHFDHEPVELPKLKVFTLGSFSLSYACFVVAQVHAPRVRDLTLMAMTSSDYTRLIAMLTRKFKQVRILTLYSVELRMNPMGKRTFVRWLESMPELGYARLARIDPEILNMFAENPMNYRKPMESGSATPEGNTPAGHVLCPKFQCMEIQAVPAEAIVEFCRLRKGIGIPMKKLYLNTPWAKSLEHEKLKLLQQETTLYFAPVGVNTEEEDKLLSEGWNA